jgi:hypothetical protein
MGESMRSMPYRRYLEGVLAIGGILALSASPGCGGGDDTVGAGTSSDADAASSAVDAAKRRDGTVENDGMAKGDTVAEVSVRDVASDAQETADASANDSPSSSGCPVQTVTSRAGLAQSTGFTGTEDAYFTLFSVLCAVASDCVPSCVAAGGTTDSCSTGSQCVSEPTLDSGTLSECLPPTYWLDPDGALGPPDASVSPADDDQAFDNGYNDTLQLTQFNVSVPGDAIIQGIEFQVDRKADDDMAADESVRILQSGVAVGNDEKKTGTWPMTYTETPYGGANDTWGASWSPADVESSSFGIAVTPRYLGGTNGNDHVDINSAEVTVYYTLPCE